MRRIAFPVLLLALFLAGGCRGARRVSKGKMVDAIHDMLLADQRLMGGRSGFHHHEDDTLGVYEGVFQAHGFRTVDFMHTVACLLEEPERMEKVMQEVERRLSDEAAQAEKEWKLQQWRDQMMAVYNRPVTFRQPILSDACAADTLFVRYADRKVSAFPASRWRLEPLHVRVPYRH